MCREPLRGQNCQGLHLGARGLGYVWPEASSESTLLRELGRGEAEDRAEVRQGQSMPTAGLHPRRHTHRKPTSLLPSGSSVSREAARAAI